MKEKCYKKIVSLILAFSLLLPLLPAAAAGDKSTITVDGTDWTGWTEQMGGANQMTLSTEDGKMTVGVPGGSKAGDHVVLSSVSVPVKPDTTYDISYTLSQQGIRGVTAWVRVFEQNVTPVDMLATHSIYAQDTGVVTATGQYTSGSNVEYAIIWVVAMNAIDQPAGTDGTVILDDLLIWEHVEEPETTEPSEPTETTEPTESTEPTETTEPLPVAFDGGFEAVLGDAFTNWFPGNSANALSVKPGTVANSGNYAAMFSGGAQGYQDISSAALEVKPNTTYDISYFVKNVDFIGATGYVSVFKNGDPGAPIGQLDFLPFFVGDSSFGTDWKQLKGQFTTDSETTSVALRFTVHTWAVASDTTGRTLYIDDVAVEKVPIPPMANNGSFDGGFEIVDPNYNTLPNWSLNNPAANAISAAAGRDAHSGNSSLHLTATEKGTYQQIVSNPIAVEPNTTYDLSYFVKNAGLIGGTGYLSVFADNGEMLGKEDLDGSVFFIADESYPTDWQQLRTQFTTGENTGSVQIRITVHTHAAGDNVSGSVLMDDVSMEELVATEPTEPSEPTETTEPTEPTEPTETTEPLPVTFDGGFEAVLGDAFTNWFPGNSANTLSVKPGTVVNSGSYAAMFSGGAQGYQDISSAALEVKPNTTYDISYFVKNVDFIGATGYVSVFKNGDPGAPIGRLDFLPFFVGDSTFGTDWKQMKGQFTTDSETTSVALRFTVHTWAVASDTTGRTLYIDDVAVKEVPIPPMANSGSFDGGFEIVDPNYNTLPNWSLNNPAANAISATAGRNAHSGNSSLRLTATEKGTYQQIVSNPIAVKPNTTYDLSYFVKNAGLIGGTGYLSVFADNGEMLGKEDLDGSVFFIADKSYPTGWQKLQTQFTTGKKTASVQIRITVHTHAAGDNVSGSVLIDDVSFAVAPNPPMANDGSFDGGFEIVDPNYNTLPNWSLNNPAANAISATAGRDAHSGNSSLRLTATEKGTYQQIVSNPIAVKPNTTYDLSYFVKNAGLIGGTGYLSVFADSGEMLGKEDLDGSVFFIADESYPTGWQQLQTQFTTGKKTASVQIRITVHTHAAGDNVSGSVLIDDVSFAVAPNPPMANSGSFDGGFEIVDPNYNTLPNWSLNNPAANAISATAGRDAHSGNSSLRLTATEKGTYQQIVSNPIAVKPNTTYDLSYFVKNAGLIGGTGYLSVFADSGEMLGKEDLDGSVFFIADKSYPTGWQKLQTQFTTGKKTASVQIRITVHTHAAGDNVSGSVLIDDVSFAVAPNPPMANDGSFDGGFEIVDPDYNILVNWTVGNTAYNAISATAGRDAHSGNSSLKFTATEKGTYQQVLSNAYEVEPNVTYELSYFVKNAGLIGATGYVSVFSNGTELLGKEDLDGSVFYISDNSYGSAWNELKPQFTTKEDTEFVVVRFTVHTHAAEGEVSGSVYLDDVTIQVAPPPPKANTGSFDGGFELYDPDHNILTNWTIINKAPNAIAATPGKEVHGGNSSLKFTANSKGTYQELLSNQIFVEADALYDISYFMKNAGLIGATGYLTVYSNGRDIIGEKIDLDGSVFFIGDDNFGTDWLQLKSQIRTLADTRYLIIKITLHTHAADGSVSGSVYLDDLTVGEHVHVFDQMDYHDQYLAAMATEDSPTLFYYSCFCGEIGTETFSYGEPLPKPIPEETDPEQTEPEKNQTETENTPETPSNNGWWILSCAAAAVAAAVVFLLLWKKKKRH